MPDIDVVWLNRIGIVLNLWAGFLMAPDLIGKERLRRLEGALESQIQRTQRFLGRFYRDPRLPADLPSPSGGVVFWTVAILVLLTCSAAFWFAVWYLELRVQSTIFQASLIVVLILLLSVIFLVIWYRITPTSIKFPVRLGLVERGRCLVLLLLLIGTVVIMLFVFGILLGTTFLFFTLLPMLADKLLTNIVSRMEGDDRLAGLLLFIGIAFFIIGNALQLVATIGNPSS